MVHQTLTASAGNAKSLTVKRRPSKLARTAVRDLAACQTHKLSSARTGDGGARIASAAGCDAHASPITPARSDRRTGQRDDTAAGAAPFRADSAMKLVGEDNYSSRSVTGRSKGWRTSPPIGRSARVLSSSCDSRRTRASAQTAQRRHGAPPPLRRPRAGSRPDQTADV